MAEISIDQSKLPGVKEVCRDFAVLEDHTLAHSLQEQEIEHHLATNVQRNRLVQYDLQMAKQLQEEEDRKARARIQEHHKDLEQQDCEIAQEIQVKLVIEAEQRRRQEEDDEDIARILQQKELQEEKRRKKPQPEAVRHGPYEEGYQPESRDHSCGSPREPAPEPARPRRPRSGDRQTQQPREHRRGPPLLSEGLDLEVLGSSSEVRKARDGRRHDRARRDRNPGSQDKPRKPPSDAEDERVDRGGGRTSEGRGRRPASRERTRGPPSPKLDGGGSREWRERRPRSRERPPRPPPLLVDWEDEGASAAHGSRRHRKRQGRHSPGSEKSPQSPISNGDAPGWRSDRRHGSSCSPNPDCHKLPPHEDRQYPRPPSRDPRLPDAEAPPRRGHRRGAEGDSEGGAGDGAGGPPSSRHGEGWEMAPGRHRNPGTKSRGTKEAIYHKPRVTVTAAAQDLEFYDAEIARKLQEEELLASQVDKRAAQVAQDEEIARLLMAEEKKAYKKAKEREKSSEKRKQDQDWKQHEAQELGGPRSREGHEPHQARSDKPTRLPPPPTDDLDQRCSVTSQHHTARQISKPDPSHKGYHYKQ